MYACIIPHAPGDSVSWRRHPGSRGRRTRAGCHRLATSKINIVRAIHITPITVALFSGFLPGLTGGDYVTRVSEWPGVPAPGWLQPVCVPMPLPLGLPVRLPIRGEGVSRRLVAGRAIAGPARVAPNLGAGRHVNSRGGGSCRVRRRRMLSVLFLFRPVFITRS